MGKSAVLFVCCHGAAAAAVTRCVFLVGSGETSVGPVTTTDTAGYWGGDTIVKFTPFCTSRAFIHVDTKNQGWDSEYLQKQYCQVSVGEDKASTVIEDTVVFSHSMGNLVFAAALKNSHCSLGSSARWYSASAPWLGSKAATWVEGLCANLDNSASALQWLARELNYCDGNHSSIAYQSMVVNYPGLDDLVGVAQKHVSRAMCGDSSFGLNTKYSFPLQALALAVKYGEDNDGMVAVSSCVLPGKTYSGHPTAPFYMAKINHADGTCRNGNGDFGNDARQPSTWYATIGEELAAHPLRDSDSVLV